MEASKEIRRKMKFAEVNKIELAAFMLSKLAVDSGNLGLSFTYSTNTESTRAFKRRLQ